MSAKVIASHRSLSLVPPRAAILVLLLPLLVLLPGCALTPEPTMTPLPTATPLPTSVPTNIPPTSTERIGETATATAGPPTLLPPASTPTSLTFATPASEGSVLPAVTAVSPTLVSAGPTPTYDP